MDLQLAGKVGIVTGASRGIGRAIAGTLAEEGVRLALAARSRDQLDELAASLPTESLVRAVDLREPGAPAAVVAATTERFGRIDLLVNNAGATKRGDFLTLSDADWEDGYALKFFAALRCCRAAWPHLVRSQGPWSTSSEWAGGRGMRNSRSAARSTRPCSTSPRHWPIAALATECGSTPSIRASSPPTDCGSASRPWPRNSA
jgi:NAD(P)-dependent dehydrogenase (short-subunit alcohol dehydrogenase family)